MNSPPPWILLRGLMRDRRHWGGFVDTLGRHFPGSAIETLDFPGNGDLNGERSLPTVEAMTEHCRRVLRARGLAPPYRVLAMSLGAMAAASWAQCYPQELQACVLINTSLRPFSRFWERLRPAVYPAALRLALRAPRAREAEALVLQLTSARPARHAVLDDWTAWHLEHPVSKTNALRQLRAAMGYVTSREPPRVPVLVLAGAGDGLVNPVCSHRLAAAWCCDFREHPWAGHDLPLDDGEWLAGQVANWASPRQR